MITINQWLNWACLELKEFPNPKLDAEILLSKVINKSRTQLLILEKTILENDYIEILKLLISRRKKGEPIAYLIGLKEFWSLNFKVSPGTFIPRPDTECLVEQVLNTIPSSSDLKVLDLGTGVGTIALSLASERPNWNIIGVDKNKQALRLAFKNKLSFNFKNVNFTYSNWFKHLHKKKFNLIVSNPPYINRNHIYYLSNDIYFEPKNALISKNSGLSDLAIICQYSVNHLFSQGWLFLEHGWNQGKNVRKLLHKFGFNNIHTVLDYHHYERVTYGHHR